MDKTDLQIRKLIKGSVAYKEPPSGGRKRMLEAISSRSRKPKKRGSEPSWFSYGGRDSNVDPALPAWGLAYSFQTNINSIHKLA
jgi:hypothetical protein